MRCRSATLRLKMRSRPSLTPAAVVSIEEPVVSVHQEIFYTVEWETTIGNPAAAAS